MKKEDPNYEEVARTACRQHRARIEALSGIRHEDVDFAFLSKTMGQRSPPASQVASADLLAERVTPAEIRVIEEAVRRTAKDGGISTIAVLLVCMMPTLITMAMALYVWLYVW